MGKTARPRGTRSPDEPLKVLKGHTGLRDLHRFLPGRLWDRHGVTRQHRPAVERDHSANRWPYSRGIPNRCGLPPRSARTARRIVTASHGRHRPAVGRGPAARSWPSCKGHTGTMCSPPRLRPGRDGGSSRPPRDDTARLWDADHRQFASWRLVLAELKGHYQRSADLPLRSARTGRRIVTASGGSAPPGCGTRTAANRTGRSSTGLHTMIDVLRRSFSPDGTRIVTAVGFDNTARLWDARQRRTELAVLKGHTGYVTVRLVQPGRDGGS